MIDTSGIQDFLKDTKSLCRSHGVTFSLIRRRSLLCDDEGSIHVSGYFDSVNKELAVAKNRGDWLPILVHESCHLDQWIEQCECWVREERLGNYVVDQWLAGQDYDRRKIRRAINNIISLELDCEKRALKKINQYDLPINQATYLQRANAYLMYYNRLIDTRLWPDPAVYEFPEVYQKFPSRFMSDKYYKTLSPKVEKIFFNQGL